MSDFGEIIDDLVHQFSDPLAFLRELVQNAIDAGSGEVCIDLRYDETRGHALIEVTDFGEGMTQEIIETRLVRLFASGKDEDFTKIGRFGIGFISVYAIEPDLVILETGREGQYWRVLFLPDRSYELYELARPVEGTRVELHKSMPVEEFEAFRERSRRVLSQWCRHAQIPVIFEGEDLQEPFDLESSVIETYHDEGTRIVAGFVHPGQDRSGYFNRGLTLKEADFSPYPWASFKIDSRYLEHTLTRDRILEDQHFVKAQKLVENLVYRDLPRKLFAELEKLTASEIPASPEEWRRYEEWMAFVNHYLLSLEELPRAPKTIDWVTRSIFFSSQGPLNLQKIAHAYRSPRHSLRFARHLPTQNGGDHLVVLLGPGPACQNLLQRFIEIPPELEFKESAETLELTPAEPHEEALEKALLGLFKTENLNLQVRWNHFRNLSNSLQNHSLLLLPGIEPIHPRKETILGFRDLHRANFLVINRSCPAVLDLHQVAAKEPEWAACALLRLLGVTAEEDRTVETFWLTRGIECRKKRLRSLQTRKSIHERTVADGETHKIEESS